MGRKGTLFPHFQFISQIVSPSQIVIMTMIVRDPNLNVTFPLRRRSDWNAGGRMAGLTVKVLL